MPTDAPPVNVVGRVGAVLRAVAAVEPAGASTTELGLRAGLARQHQPLARSNRALLDPGEVEHGGRMAAQLAPDAQKQVLGLFGPMKPQVVGQ